MAGARRALLQRIPLLGALPALPVPAGAAPDVNAVKWQHREFLVLVGTKSPEEEDVAGKKEVSRANARAADKGKMTTNA